MNKWMWVWVLAAAAPAAAQTAPVGSWTPKATSASFFNGSASASDGARLWWFGNNSNGTNGVQGEGLFRYDPLTDTHAQFADMPQQVLNNSGAYYNGYLYSFGSDFLPYPPGYGGTFQADAIFKYSIATNTWTRLAVLSTRNQSYASAATVGSKIYINGGYPNYGSTGFVPGALTEFDPVTETLTPRASIPAAISWHASAGGSNGKLYVFGGYEGETTIVAKTFEYDPATDAWTPRADFVRPMAASAAIALNDLLYLTGGASDDAIYTDCLEFDPATNAWRAVASMNMARVWHAAGAIDGKGYVFGGVGNPDPSTSCEEFVPPDFGAPPTVTDVEQRQGPVAVAQGGSIVTMVRFAALVEDDDAGQLVKFEVQYRAATESDWTDAPEVSTGLTTPGVLTIDVVVPSLGGYDWRWRAMDAVGNVSGAWTDFGDPTVSPDFVSVTPPQPVAEASSSGGSGGGGCSAGAVPCSFLLPLLIVAIAASGARRSLPRG